MFILLRLFLGGVRLKVVFLFLDLLDGARDADVGERFDRMTLMLVGSYDVLFFLYGFEMGYGKVLPKFRHGSKAGSMLKKDGCLGISCVG